MTKQRPEIADTPRPCVVCGGLTRNRTATLDDEGRLRYRTYRCANAETCAMRRNQKRRRKEAA